MINSIFKIIFFYLILVIQNNLIGSENKIIFKLSNLPFTIFDIEKRKST